jgi:hypothetical protein
VRRRNPRGYRWARGDRSRPARESAPYLASGSVIVEAGGVAAPTVEQLRAAIATQSAAGSRPLILRVLQPGQDNHIFVAFALDEFTAEPAQLLTDAGVAYDRGENAVFSTELAARHLLAAVAAGDAEAVTLLTERPTTLNQTTREIIQRRLADAGHYRGQSTACSVRRPAAPSSTIDRAVS